MPFFPPATQCHSEKKKKGGEVIVVAFVYEMVLGILGHKLKPKYQIRLKAGVFFIAFLSTGKQSDKQHTKWQNWKRVSQHIYLK